MDKRIVGAHCFTNTFSSFYFLTCLCFLSLGEILRFILSRDGIELYRGLDLEYTDDTTILPYKSYKYTLTACTVAGCISSLAVSYLTLCLR